MSSKFLSDDEFMGGSAAGSGTLLSDDEFLGGAPAAKAEPKAVAESGGFIDQVKKGFVSGLVDQNPQMVGNAMDAIAELSDPSGPQHAGDLVGRMVPAKPGGKARPMEETPQRLRDLAAQVKAWGQQGAETRQPNVPSFTSIRTDSLSNLIGDAGDYAGYLIGSGVGTSAPSIVAGVAGAAATKSPLGFIASAAGPSYVQNLGDTYGALLENEGVKKAMADGTITRKQVASIAAEAAIPMAALDAASLEGVIGLNATGLKQNIVKRIIQRVGVGALTEGTTEGIQQVVQEAAIDVAGGDKTLAQQAVSVIDNAIGGALAGGAMSAATSPAAGSHAQEPGVTPVDQTTNIPQGAADAETLFGQESAGGNADIPADTAAGGPPPPPAATSADIERERPDSPRLTSEDRASPLPNNLIDDGKAIFEKALGGGEKTKSAEPLDGQIITPAQQREAAQRVADIAGEFGTPASQAAAPALEHTIDGTLAPAGPDAAPVRPLSDREFIDGISVVDDAAHSAATSPLNDLAQPTDPMKNAGNYIKGHTTVGGLDVSIENPQGSERSGVDPSGKPWKQTLQSHYGYVKGSISSDGDHVDVFIKPGTPPDLADGSPVFVVNQTKEKGGFDETKTMLGFGSQEEADAAYHANYAKGWKGGGNIVPTTLGEFKGWLANGDTTKPFGTLQTTPQIEEKKLTSPAEPAAQAALKQKIIEKRTARGVKIPDLVQFLAANGGISDYKGEAGSLGLKNHFVPGIGKLMSEKGMPLDRAREIAEEAGYIGKAGDYQTTTVADLLDAIDKNMRGQRIYAREDAGKAENRAAEKPLKTDSEEQARHDDFNQMVKEFDLNDDETTQMQAAVERGEWASEAIGDILERRAIAFEGETHDFRGQGETEDGFPPFDTAAEDRTGEKPEDQGRDRQTDARAAERGPTAVRQPAEAERSGRPKKDGKGESALATEPGAEGKLQSVIPGAEKISQGQQAQREADKPLRAKAPQKDAGELFDTQARSEKQDGLPFFALRRKVTKSPAFKKWFGKSKVVDANGEPQVVFHGAARSDRINPTFDKRRATSGPMAFFIDDPEIASSYSTKKPDTSLDDEEHLAQRFVVKAEGMRKGRRIDEAWWSLPSDERARIASRASRVYETDDGEIALDDQPRKDGIGNYDYELKSQRGDHLKALAESWLHSGQIFGEEERFMEVLKLAGMTSPVEYVDPNFTAPGVFPVYLSIKNPLDTSAIPSDVVAALDKASRRQRNPKYESGKDQWDKTIQKPADWMGRLHDDAKSGSTHAWTSIPDWVTNTLRSLGYDGIKDTGGKGGGQGHNVWIPFDEEQVKSVNNRGTFSATDRQMMFKARPETVQPTDAFAAQAQDIGTRLRAELDRLGLKDIGLRISENLGLMVDGKMHAADGSYFRKLITVALDADNPDSVLDHEAIHALRDVGAFSKDEWAILERKSRKEWRDRYAIAESYGSFPDGVQTEEGIAHAYADWRAGRSMDGIIAKAFKKIRGILQAIGKAFGKDFRSAADVFEQVSSGEVGNRSPDEQISKDETSFKLRDPQTAEDRQKTMQGMIARGQPLDRALRLPFQFFGGVDEKGRWKPGLHLSDKAAKIITTSRVDPQGRFGWLAGPIEAARAGLIDRYGLAPEYIERDRQRHMDERAITMRGAEVLKTLAEQNVGTGEARVLQAILTGEAVSDSAMQQLAAPIRQAIDELGQEAVSLGLVSAESFERNRGAYLHRVYAKHESEQNNLQKLVSQVMGRKRKQIIGDELKGRGLFWDVPRDELLRHSSSAQAMRKADSQIGGIETRIDTLASRREVLEGELKTLGREMAAHMGRRMDVADRATIKKMVGESRTTKPSSFQKGQVLEQAVALNRLRDRIEQREAALDKLDGEIAAAQQRIDELSDHLIAQSENLSVTKDSKFVVLDKTVDKDGKERVAQRVYIPADEQVPERFSGPEWTNRGTWEARQIGKGKVTLWRDYSQAERTKMGEILDARYTIGKTYLYMAHDLATGRFYKDIAENEDWTSSSEPAAKSVEAEQFRRHWNDRDVAWVKVPDTTISDTGGKKRWGALSGKWVRSEIWRDLNEIDIMNRPSTWRMLLTQWKKNKTMRSPVTHMNNVMSNLMLMDMQDVRMQDLQAGIRSFINKDKHWQDANEHGVFGADMMTQEIRDNVLKPILDEIEKQGQDGVQNSFLARAGILGKFADKLWGGLKFADQKMLDAYRIEDDVFRLASYRAGIARGESPEHAAAAAREQFLDYDIRAPWVNAARNSLLPFISYTYRAVPLIARAMATRPWKLAKYAMVAYALNALAYAWDDDGDEDKERASLRDEEQGYSWLGTPRMLRMPFRNGDGLPVFLDIRRWIPAGDVFDTNQGSSVLPIPAPLQFGGPMMLGAELALNKSAFTGDPIRNELTDTWLDAAGKTGDYLWKSWLPSAAWVPNSWYWTKIENAIKGATDIKGRPYSLPEAIASSVGIKLKPQDVETGIFWQYKDMKDVEQALRAEARTLARQRDRGLISQKAFDAGMQTLIDKRDVLVEHVKELQRATRKK